MIPLDPSTKFRRAFYHVQARIQTHVMQPMSIIMSLVTESPENVQHPCTERRNTAAEPGREHHVGWWVPGMQNDCR